RTKVKVVKNKVAAPFREAEFDMLYGEGISREGDLLDLGANHGIIEKSGSWFSYKGERIGQGRENARHFLKDNRDIYAKLEAEVRKELGLIPAAAQAAAGQGPTSQQSARVTTMPTGTEGKPSVPRRLLASQQSDSDCYFLSLTNKISSSHFVYYRWTHTGIRL